jgi:hypothetical protein
LPEPDKYFEEIKPSGWEALLTGGKMRNSKNPVPDSGTPKKGADTKGKRNKKNGSN